MVNSDKWTIGANSADYDVPDQWEISFEWDRAGDGRRGRGAADDDGRRDGTHRRREQQDLPGDGHDGRI